MCKISGKIEKPSPWGRLFCSESKKEKLFGVLIQSFNNGDETGILADTVVATVLQFVKLVVTLCMLGEFIEILIFFGIDLSVNQEGREIPAVILPVRYIASHGMIAHFFKRI